jgi:hypothetical protein
MASTRMKGAVKLSSAICTIGAIFAFTQGATAPAELARMKSAEAQKNNEELQKMLDGLKHKTTGEKLQDAMYAMKYMHEIKAYNAEMNSKKFFEKRREDEK